MFITFTIDTHQKKHPKVRFTTQRFNPSNGWQKALHAKKRSLWRRIMAWRRNLKGGIYKPGGQIAMF